MQPEDRLPKYILDKSIKRGNEVGWRRSDFISVVEAAMKIPMAVIGGQVQYVFPDGTCELYWLSYDPDGRRREENWPAYCNRSADECMSKFQSLIATVAIEKEALGFEFVKAKKEEGVNIQQHEVFILYFDDSETDVY
ncbi:MAG: hypothetical protein JST90_04180 [Bacteroidetes bacterium]|nr:hypothetical protein [Bacteroidota bacterium]